jgi:hypothetical protein
MRGKTALLHRNTKIELPCASNLTETQREWLDCMSSNRPNRHRCARATRVISIIGLITLAVLFRGATITTATTTPIVVTGPTTTPTATFSGTLNAPTETVVGTSNLETDCITDRCVVGYQTIDATFEHVYRECANSINTRT